MNTKINEVIKLNQQNTYNFHGNSAGYDVRYAGSMILAKTHTKWLFIRMIIPVLLNKKIKIS